MPRIDKIIEPMSLGNYDEAALLSDSAVRLKSKDGREELGITLTHRQITSLVEEIIPSNLFGSLVMMENVEFTHQHPAGVLNIKVSPGRSLWRVEVEAPQGLEPFREKKRGNKPGKNLFPDIENKMKKNKPPEEIEDKELEEINFAELSRSSDEQAEQVSEKTSNANENDNQENENGSKDSGKSELESDDKENENNSKDSDKGELESDGRENEARNGRICKEEEKSPDDSLFPEDGEPNVDVSGSFSERLIPSEETKNLSEEEEKIPPGPTLKPTEKCSELLERAIIAESATLLLIPEQRPWIYGPQGYAPMPGAREPVTMDLLNELLENNKSVSNRLKKRRTVRVTYGHQRESSFVRCTLTRNHNRITAVFRIPLTDPAHPSHIGIPGGTTRLIEKGGVLLAASNPGQGRTTTAFVLGSALMSSGHRTALVVGRPLERKLIASAPVFSFDMQQKEMGRSMMLATDIGASVVIADDAPVYAMERAIRLAETGVSVVFTMQAKSAMSALIRCLNSLKQWKNRIDELTRLLKGVIYQELIRTNKAGQTAVFERISPTSSLLHALAKGQWDLLGGYNGNAVTSPSLAESFQKLVEKNVIDAHTAGKHISNR